EEIIDAAKDMSKLFNMDANASIMFVENRLFNDQRNNIYGTHVLLEACKGEVGHVYNIGTKKERRVIDAAKDMSKLFNMDANASIMFVENRLFNNQRPLGGIPAILIGGGDVSSVMLPHLRMLMTPGEVDRLADGPDHTEFYVADPTINTAEIGLPTIKPTHVFNAAGVTCRPKIGVNLIRRKLSVPMSWAHST
nr:hypothetical protein [Tanacetum cinerariifolium]